MSQLSVFPLGLSEADIVKLEASCVFASGRGIKWSVATSVHQSAGVIAAVNSADTLGACLHFHSVGGLIALVNAGLSHGLITIKGPLRLSGVVSVLDHFRHNSKGHAALSEHLATADLLRSFSRASEEQVATGFEEASNFEGLDSWSSPNALRDKGLNRAC